MYLLTISLPDIINIYSNEPLQHHQDSIGWCHVGVHGCTMLLQVVYSIESEGLLD